MIASLLSRTNPTAKVLVIDDKDAFSKQALFLDGWKRHYGGMVEWLPRKEHGGVTRIDAPAGVIGTAVRDIKVDVANVVPPQQAGALAFRAGLTDAGGWCPVVAETMQSTVDTDIHVIGDASRAAAMPKSAESAANQARIAGDTIAEVLTGIPSVRSRIANSCWSLIAADDGVKIGGTYAPKGTEFAETSTFVSVVGEHPSLRAATYRESLGWYRHVTSLMFGTIPA
jgi:NADPH-dependent 2,4-dienoyl-CoA reductase/sulfur reductase-like enzyme